MVRHIILSAAQDLGADINALEFTTEYPKDHSCGHFATNIAMVMSKTLQKSPRDVAGLLINGLTQNPNVQSVEIAGPGFINIKMQPEFWHECLINALKPSTPQEHETETKPDIKPKVLVEFVSANPTGPMHVGHCRGAVFGDVMCNILQACGYDVTRQYYINDAGEQIKVLAQSLYVRYQQINGVSAEIPEGGYPGNYLIDIAKNLYEVHGDALLNRNFEDLYQLLSSFAVEQVMEMIKSDLAQLGTHHNSFISELHDIQLPGMVDKAVEKLRDIGVLYEGQLEAPKGIESSDWQSNTQLIFRSTDFGDDADRVVQRQNGSYTYFAGDLGLALYRSKQHYSKVFMILGADHIGFIKRLEAIMKAFAPGVEFKVTTTQMVNLFKDGQPFKMSKRAGNFITAADVVQEVGADALRFAMLWRKNDTIIDFDFESVKQHSKDNPVFYVQYAHARATSVLAMAQHEISAIYSLDNLNLLTEFDWDLVRKAASLPRIIEQSAKFYEPHRLVHFLYELATEFHMFWAKGNSDVDLRFIIPNNRELTSARLSVVQMVLLTLKQGLKILGVEPADSL